MDSQPLPLESSEKTARWFTDAEKAAARHRYESSAPNVTLRVIAGEVGASYSSVLKWSMDGKWRKPQRIVTQAVNKLEADIETRALQLVDDKLAPFIEEHRVKFTVRAVKLAEKGLKRLESLWKEQKPNSTRSEADGARTLETFIRVGRTSLGMDDKTNDGKGLTVEMLAGSGSSLRIRSEK